MVAQGKSDLSSVSFVSGGQSSLNKDAVGKWITISKDFTVPADVTTVDIALGTVGGEGYSGADADWYLDDIEIFKVTDQNGADSLLDFKGNAIRNAADGKQGLRFKFDLNKTILDTNNLHGKNITEYGFVVTLNKTLANENFVKDAPGTVSSVAYNASTDKVFDENDTLKTKTVTAALYNIGVTGNDTNYAYYDKDYRVRMYVKAGDTTYYSTPVKASVFATANAIVKVNDKEADDYNTVTEFFTTYEDAKDHFSSNLDYAAKYPELANALSVN